jgi:hypothetical protein
VCLDSMCLDGHDDQPIDPALAELQLRYPPPPPHQRGVVLAELATLVLLVGAVLFACAWSTHRAGVL